MMNGVESVVSNRNKLRSVAPDGFYAGAIDAPLKPDWLTKFQFGEELRGFSPKQSWTKSKDGEAVTRKSFMGFRAFT